MRCIKNFQVGFLGVLVALFVGFSTVQGQTYSGQATAVKSSVKLLNLPAVESAVNDTGPLPSAGGSINLGSANTNIANILTAGVSTVETSGSGSTSQSFASVASLDTDVAGFANALRVRADLVRSDTMCDCTSGAGTGTCSGSSTITNLRIGPGNPTPVVVTGEANQIVTTSFGNVTLRIVINEQIVSPGRITANALHITLTNSTTGTVVDIIVSSSHSDITCTTPLSDDRFSGRATGVRLDQFTLIPTSSTSLIVSDTGFLPSFGGVIAVTTASTNVPGVLTTGVVTSNTSGGVIIDRPAPLPDGTADTSQSDSTVNNLNVTLSAGPDVVTISGTNTTLQSNTQCACSVLNVASCAGDSVIQNLEVRIGGVLVATITGTSAPNTTIPLVVPVLGTVLGSITLNEQTSTGPGDITVNALHVRLNPLGLASTDLIVASSHSDIECATLVPTAAPVALSGRVTDRFGRGISSVIVTVTDGQGFTKSARTNSFGHYGIKGIPAGNGYVVTASSRGYQFSPRFVSMTDNVSGFDLSPDVGGRFQSGNPTKMREFR